MRTETSSCPQEGAVLEGVVTSSPASTQAALQAPELLAAGVAIRGAGVGHEAVPQGVAETWEEGVGHEGVQAVEPLRMESQEAQS